MKRRLFRASLVTMALILCLAGAALADGKCTATYGSGANHITPGHRQPRRIGPAGSLGRRLPAGQ